MEEHYATLVLLVMESRGVSAEDANEKLLMHMPARKRRGSKAFSTVAVYRYIKRAVSHFYENLRKAAVKAFISSINESKGMGKQVLFKGSKTRTVRLCPRRRLGIWRKGTASSLWPSVSRRC